MAHTALHMTFGQLLDHDIGRTAMTMIKDKDTGQFDMTASYRLQEEGLILLGYSIWYDRGRSDQVSA